MDDDRIDYDTDERQGSVQKKKTNLKQNVVLSILRNEARGDYH